MRVRFTRRAARDLDRIFAYIARDDREAAGRVAARVHELSSGLAAQPTIGPVIQGDKRMRVAHPYPYLIIYRIDYRRSEIQILKVVHGARRKRT